MAPRSPEDRDRVDHEAVVKFAIAARVVGSVAALAVAAIAAGSSAQASFHPGAVSLTATAAGCSPAATGSECSRLFDGGQVLFPGSAPITRSITVSYAGDRSSTEAGLYLTHFTSRATRSGAGCTAADPGSMLTLTVSLGGTVLYEGTLSAFAATHADPTTLVTINGGRLNPGQAVTLTMSIAMNRAADNSYMGCASDTNFAWYAAA